MAKPLFPADPQVILAPYADRETWLEYRRDGIGGSEVGSLIGSNKYSTAEDVWLEKIEGLQPEFTRAQEERMEAGRRMENAILDWSAARLGLTVEHESLPELVADSEHPWRRASMDGVGFTEDASPAAILEAKNVGSHQTEGSLLTQYRDQVLWYEGITGIHHGYLCALIGGQDLLIIPVEWDEMRFEALCEVADQFWHEHIQLESKPTLANFPPHPDALKGKYPGDPDADRPSFTEEEGDEFVTLAARHKNLKKRAATLDAEIGEVESAMKTKMGDAEQAYVNGNMIAKWGIVTQQRVDLNQLREEFPDAAKTCTKPSTYRRFSVAAKAIALHEVV